MTESNRLKRILEKQDAADRAQVAKLARQALADSRAKAAKDRMVHEWRQLCRLLAQTMATANATMTGGRQLYSQPYNPHARGTVGDLIITFEDEYSEHVERKCIVGVQLDGTVAVSFKPQDKEYCLNILTAATEQKEGIVYDFLEINV